MGTGEHPRPGKLIERRFTECRVSGRTISGTVVRYGDVADRGHFREQFEPGAFGNVATLDATVNVMHQRNRLLGRTGRGGVTLRDEGGALLMSAALPETREAEDALTLVRNGTLRGLSSEFVCEADRWDGDLRRVVRAKLMGIGIVDRPSYQSAEGLSVRSKPLELRQRGRTLTGLIPTGRRLGCRCQGPTCNAVEFEADSLEVEPSALAVSGSYVSPLASARRGTLKTTATDAGLVVRMELPETEAVDQLVEALEAAPLFIRPFLDSEASEFEQTGDLRTYSRALVRAFIVGATDADEGLGAVEVGETRSKRRALWPSL